MFESLGNILGRKPRPKSGPVLPEAPSEPPVHREPSERRQTFSKVFRWRLPDGQTHEPSKVEVVGSFTHWQKVPLIHDGVLDAWHVTLHHLQSNRTHHYMLLVDGKPWFDKTCDGLAAARGPEEERYQLMTEKGPRVMMLFAQTK